MPRSWMSPGNSWRAQPAQCLGHSKLTLPPLRTTARAKRQNRFNISLDFLCCSSSFSASVAPYWCKFSDCHWLQGPQGRDPTLMWCSIHHSINSPRPGKPLWCGSGMATSAGTAPEPGQMVSGLALRALGPGQMVACLASTPCASSRCRTRQTAPSAS